MRRERAALNAVGGAEHAQWIEWRLYVNEHKGVFMCREHASVMQVSMKCPTPPLPGQGGG